jgi:uroporphyrinogen decarboxylase
MNSLERIKAAIRLEEPDRVPAAPLVWFHSAELAGKTARDYRENVETHLYCSEKAYKEYGYDMIYLFANPDIVNLLSHDPVRCHTCYNNEHCRIAILPDPIIKTRKEAKDFINKGAINYLNLKPEFIKGLAKWGKDAIKLYPPFVKKWWAQGVPVSSGGTALGVDLTAMLRGLKNFFYDLRKHPRELMELMEFVHGLTKTFAVRAVKMMGKHSFNEIGCWLGSPTFISPQDFDKFIFPYLTDVCDAVKKAGGHVTAHLDGDYTRTIDKIAAIDSIDLIQLEYTNLVEAKKKVGNKKCISGGLHPSHLVLHSPKQVLREAGQLIRKCAKGGGFILSSACEVPMNAKPSNIKALVKAAKTIGKYPIK